MDPITITTTVITFATALKDLVQVAMALKASLNMVLRSF